MIVNHTDSAQGTERVTKEKPKYRCSLMVEAVIKMRIAKTEKQANIVLLVFSMFNVLVSTLLLLASPSIFI